MKLISHGPTQTYTNSKKNSRFRVKGSSFEKMTQSSQLIAHSQKKRQGESLRISKMGRRLTQMLTDKKINKNKIAKRNLRLSE